MVKQMEWCVRGMSVRAVRESEKRLAEQRERGGVSVVANLRPFLMAKSPAVRMEAEAGSLQAVAVDYSRV